MAIFNDVEPEARASINNALTDDTSDEFSIGVRYINDVSAYHPSDRYFELLVVSDGAVSCLKNDSRFSVPHHSVMFSFPGEGGVLVAACRALQSC